MTPEDITYIKTLVTGLGYGALIAVGIGYLLLKHYSPSYLTAKGKNLADKEDIKKITELVEQVKLQTSITVEQFKAKHQLRMAALDKRLGAHQEAFKWWQKLVSSAHSEDVVPVVIGCQDWWVSNCLYLEPAARQALSMAYIFAAGHRKLVESGNYRPRDAALVAEIETSWKHVMDAGQIIMESAELPGLSERELKLVQDKPGVRSATS
ncbi:hypothetical protein [Variovorax sp. WS11]|uniref:hypothetical protein n=1 Tax=Variovorax sp. WS11 TaxID=1105204 RepID=UPI0011B29D45|nr:hypothetical protein [Variovorax sp. WS11]NDZ15555.1 hypothetical protein [Variovorax sp. WS11]